MTTEQWAVSLMSGGGLVLLKSLFDYYTGKAKAKREANKDDANILKTLSDSYKVRVGADIEINQQWKALNDYLNKELEKERKECDIKIESLNKRLIGALEEIKELKRINARRV